MRVTSTTFPERIGRYEVLLPIASGGMGAVYLARVKGLGGFEREVAIKLMHAHLKESESFAHDLLEEAKLTVRIRHPNVVSVIDVGDDPFGLFIVMDYIEGDTISGLRRRASKQGEKIPRRIGLRVLVDALTGLHAAHETRDESGALLAIVHRDFSPQNIIVGVDGVGRLVDFGIAKATTQTSHTAAGLVKGKISYMSPEQARGATVDRRCDVWAAGVVAWEILAGRPLHGEAGVNTLLKIVGEAPPRARSIAPDVPQEIDDVVASALTLDVESRCPTALALKQRLVAACRSCGEWAESEEVGEYVTRLAGPMLAERRTKIVELGELRKKMGQIAAASEKGTPSGSSQAASAPQPDDASTFEVGTRELGTSEIGTREVGTRMMPGREGPVTRTDPAPPPLHVELTDATAVTTGKARARGPSRVPQVLRNPWVLAGGGAAALAIGLVAYASLGGHSTPSEPAAASASPPPPVDSVLAATATALASAVASASALPVAADLPDAAAPSKPARPQPPRGVQPRAPSDQLAPSPFGPRKP